MTQLCQCQNGLGGQTLPAGCTVDDTDPVVCVPDGSQPGGYRAGTLARKFSTHGNSARWDYDGSGGAVGMVVGNTQLDPTLLEHVAASQSAMIVVNNSCHRMAYMATINASVSFQLFDVNGPPVSPGPEHVAVWQFWMLIGGGIINTQGYNPTPPFGLPGEVGVFDEDDLYTAGTGRINNWANTYTVPVGELAPHSSFTIRPFQSYWLSTAFTPGIGDNFRDWKTAIRVWGGAV